MQNINITTDRAQKGDEKNGVICLVTMFASKVIVIFCWYQQIIIRISVSSHERSYGDFSKKGTLWGYCLSDMEGRNEKNC